MQSRFLKENGFEILGTVVSKETCERFAIEVDQILASRPDDSISESRQRIVGGRNLLSHWTGWRALFDNVGLREFVSANCGSKAGVVRILYFDKPPGHSWALSMHKDRTIAVAEHRVPPDPFSKPTTKAGVAHVEADDALLKQMLTLRLHLDPMHDQNGPLVVCPGSHVSTFAKEIREIHCNAGDVFAMHPLLSHSSRSADSANTDHRRVVHLEIAPTYELPGGYRWYQFEAP